MPLGVCTAFLIFFYTKNIRGYEKKSYIRIINKKDENDTVNQEARFSERRLEISYKRDVQEILRQSEGKETRREN